jgi:hypothetical protein
MTIDIYLQPGESIGQGLIRGQIEARAQAKAKAQTEAIECGQVIDSWNHSDDPPGDGWFAVLLSYEEDGISPGVMQFANGRAVTLRAGGVVAHAGPFPDQPTAEAWAFAHDPDWPD